MRRSRYALLCLLALAACSRGASSGAVPARADSGYVGVPGASLFYKSFGSGDPIILVHGGPGMDHAYLLPGMRALAESHRVVFYDQRGGGRTSGTVDRSTVSSDIFLADITALADSLHMGKFTLLAHSWGGIPVVRYAARYPELLRALVLMNTVEPGRRYAMQSMHLLAQSGRPRIRSSTRGSCNPTP